ncbi:MAG: hypothetical protein MJ175_10900, partial [Clostridia bacterium]|nr:hypothetical protein [Clostridia bacterium]
MKDKNSRHKYKRKTPGEFFSDIFDGIGDFLEVVENDLATTHIYPYLAAAILFGIGYRYALDQSREYDIIQLQLIIGIAIAIGLAAAAWKAEDFGMYIRLLIECCVIGILFDKIVELVSYIAAAIMIGGVLGMFSGLFEALGVATVNMVTGIVTDIALIGSLPMIVIIAPLLIAVVLIGIFAAAFGGVGWLAETILGRLFGRIWNALPFSRIRLQGKALVAANLAALILIGWPLLSFGHLLTGIAAFKPAERAYKILRNITNQELPYGMHVSLYTKNWSSETSDGHFYSRYVRPPSNSVWQLDREMIPYAGNETMTFSMNNQLHEFSYRNGEFIRSFTYEYPQTKDDVYLAYTCLFNAGRYVVMGNPSESFSLDWKKNVEKPDEELFDYLYSVLEKQNTDAASYRLSRADGAALAYCQRNGSLLQYDEGAHTAFFGSRAKDGTVTVYRQTDTGNREQIAVFRTDYRGDSLPYLLYSDEEILYLDGNRIEKLNFRTNTVTTLLENKPHETFGDGKAHAITSMFAAYNPRDEHVYIIAADKDAFLFVDPDGNGACAVEYDMRDVRTMFVCQDCVYGVIYEDSLLHKLTYFGDVDTVNDASWFHRFLYAVATDTDRW